MDIKKTIKSSGKFLLIPLPFAGTVITIAGFLVHLEWIVLDFDVFGLLYDPLFMIYLSIGSFLYIDKFYKDKLTCTCHTGKRQKFHHIAAYVLGMLAAFVFYLMPVAVLSFIVLDSHSDVQILATDIGVFSIPLPLFVALFIFGAIARFMVRDVFESVDGKSGTLFNMKKSILTQVREHVFEIKELINEIRKNPRSVMKKSLSSLFS